MNLSENSRRVVGKLTKCRIKAIFENRMTKTLPQNFHKYSENVWQKLSKSRTTLRVDLLFKAHMIHGLLYQICSTHFRDPIQVRTDLKLTN